MGADRQISKDGEVEKGITVERTKLIKEMKELTKYIRLTHILATYINSEWKRVAERSAAEMQIYYTAHDCEASLLWAKKHADMMLELTQK